VSDDREFPAMQDWGTIEMMGSSGPGCRRVLRSAASGVDTYVMAKVTGLCRNFLREVGKAVSDRSSGSSSSGFVDTCPSVARASPVTTGLCLNLGRTLQNRPKSRGRERCGVSEAPAEVQSKCFLVRYLICRTDRDAGVTGRSFSVWVCRSRG
jgi:hypothetical protein